jgi:phosphoribosylaminoimidazole carboxylase (NCAIR synthetase)
MKEALRKAGVPCAQSAGVDSIEALQAFASRVGYPLILKPRDGAGASGTRKVANDDELLRAAHEAGLAQGRSIAVEEFIEGHEAFYDTITANGRVIHEFITHYYPGVLEAMRTRWISPVFITTNRVDSEGYEEVKHLGRRVIGALGIHTSPTHMEWFYGPKGLQFSEIGCRPPGVGAWDLYAAGNEFDIFREWALASMGRPPLERPSRRYAAAMINLRPDRAGQISHSAGIDEVERRFGGLILDYHLPPAGSPTMGVEAGYMANAWMRLRHPDYDTLREILNFIGETVQVRAR